MLALIDALIATEPLPIPDDVAIATLERIAAEQRRELNDACRIDDLAIVISAGGQVTEQAQP